MPSLIKLALKANEIDKVSERPSAREFLINGKNIFGQNEDDGVNSSKFLVVLLNCIETWSSISSEFAE